ncbi:hypothetical protein [Enterococcus sp. DIV0187]|uniref:hypothetical protein n=1 Tax=Enterococcus sp. DIV0187 TaxID=2774644 RepID=UPI003F278FB8
MADKAISTANLSIIEGNLQAINQRMELVDDRIGAVDQNLHTVYQELAELAKEFHTYVDQANRQHNLSVAETRLVKIRQELESTYGHYDEVRRTTLGILQADDLEVIRKETITSISEEMMLNAPNYWLASCTVAVSAWINDDQKLAERAVKEAIRRDDEKTSLLFALICRRAGRKQASLKWVARFLENQEEENLDRQTIIIIDAFASGLLGVDSEGLVSSRLEEWLKKIAEKTGFTEQQIDQWSQAINLYRPHDPGLNYPYLKKYSPTYPQILDVFKGALLHERLLDYFVNIFQQPNSTRTLKEQLDEILFTLVSSFDDEETPLRKDELLNHLVIENGGDMQSAHNEMKIEETALDQKKDYSQLLTDAALKPESTNASYSTQKYAISVSKDWITDAYNDVVATNRACVPHQIELALNGFSAATIDGENENEIIAKYIEHMDAEKEKRLSQLVTSNIGIIAGIGIAVLGIAFLGVLGWIAAIAGGYFAWSTYSKNKQILQQKETISQEMEERKTSGQQIIRAMIAEAVDFRKDFEKEDKNSKKVLDFLKQLSPDHYIRSLSGEKRKINVGGGK